MAEPYYQRPYASSTTLGADIGLVDSIQPTHMLDYNTLTLIRRYSHPHKQSSLALVSCFLSFFFENVYSVWCPAFGKAIGEYSP